MRSGSSVIAAVLAVAACSGGSSKKVDETTPPDRGGEGGEGGSDTPAAPKVMSLADSGIVPEWIDANTDPCEDFFQYACGGFLATAEIPPDRSSWGTISIIDERNEKFLKQTLEDAAANPGSDPVKQKLGDYYAACMDEAAIEAAGTKPLEPFLAEIAKVKDAKTAAQAVIQLHTLGLSPLFGLYPSQDFADATQVIANVDQAGLGMPDRDYYLKSDKDMKDVRVAYTAHIGRMFALLGADTKEQKTAVADVMRIETALAKVQQDVVTRRNPRAIYHRIDRKGLEKAAPTFPWGDYFAALGIPDVTAISAHDPKYYGKVAALLKKEKPAALRHYLQWRLISGVAEDLGKAWRDEKFAMLQVLTGIKEQPPRWRTCIGAVDEDLGELLGQPYVAKNFAGSSKQDAIDLTKAVYAAFDANLDSLAWMDQATRDAAKEKLRNMGYLIGYPDKWREYTFPISRTDFAGNVFAASRFELARNLAKIGKPVDRNEWGMTPPTVNAYYDWGLNQIALPAGQLQPPFFGATFHPAVNFGATGGGTIGHEVTHGFDDEGSQFDANGNLRDWWSKETKKEFAAATRCVQDQYSQYEAVPGIKLKGDLTSGENIADIGGVKIGYQAYQAWKAQQSPPPPAKVGDYTDDQLYFLAYGQSWCIKRTPEAAARQARSNPHSPPQWRVNGVIVDQPAFGQAWSCKAGTKMNPEKKCVVW
jgi:putative endopeptidase